MRYKVGTLGLDFNSMVYVEKIETDAIWIAYYEGTKAFPTHANFITHFVFVTDVFIRTPEEE